jgi:hypothetical protein
MNRLRIVAVLERAYGAERAPCPEPAAGSRARETSVRSSQPEWNCTGVTRLMRRQPVLSIDTAARNRGCDSDLVREPLALQRAKREPLSARTQLQPRVGVQFPGGWG